MELVYCHVPFLMFTSAVAFFHTSEYLLAVAIHGRSNTSWNSLLISRQYIIAMAFSLFEYYIEVTFLPELKAQWWITNIGLLMVLSGEAIRKAAILTAGSAFTHVIRVQHDNHHELITGGIYRFVRHPGYCGFFIWSIGTQFLLCNPISMVGFTAVTWKFFSTRIPYEEFFLRQFFGPRYVEYAELVPSGIPFIK